MKYVCCGNHPKCVCNLCQTVYTIPFKHNVPTDTWSIVSLYRPFESPFLALSGNMSDTVLDLAVAVASPALFISRVGSVDLQGRLCRTCCETPSSSHLSQPCDTSFGAIKRALFNGAGPVTLESKLTKSDFSRIFCYRVGSLAEPTL